MRILVLIKQVPALGAIAFVPQLNRIAREGVAALTNPLDREALATAVALAGPEDEIVAVTMGPPAARAVLEEAVAQGADRAVHLCDMFFAGADTLATARAFAQLVARERADLVIGGRTSLDGATAQVLPQLAELAGLAVATEADTVRIVDGAAEIGRLERGERVVRRAPLPAAVSVRSAPACTATRRAGTGPIEELDAAALGGDPAGYGIRGSATYVQAVEPRTRPEPAPEVHDPAEAAQQLVVVAEAPRPTVVARPVPAAGAPEIWVVVEKAGPEIAAVSREALAVAGDVAASLGAAVVALVFGDASPREVDLLGGAGADVVRSLCAPDLAPDDAACLAAALCRALESETPLAVLGQWTLAQRDWLARAAARRALGMTGDVTGLTVAPRPGDGAVQDVVWLKPTWSGAALARVVARTVPAFGTLRPGSTTGSVTPRRVPSLERRELGPLETPAVSSPAANGSTSGGPASGGPASGNSASGDNAVGRLPTQLPAATEVEGAGVVVLAGAGLAAADLAAGHALAAALGGVLARSPGAPGDALPVVAPTTHALSPRLAVVLAPGGADELVPLGLAGTLAVVGDAPAPVDLVLRCTPGALAAAVTAQARA